MKTAENTKKRVCFYLRNSTVQNQDYIFQREALTIELSKRNDVVLVAEYAEKISGALEEIKDRPEMFKLMQAVKNKEFDELWSYDLKRVARNAIVLLTICRDCTKNNVNVFFMQDGLNTLNPDGSENSSVKMLLGFLGEMANQDKISIIEKGAYGKVTKVRAGNYVGGTLPTGYTYINDINLKTKKIIIDNNEKIVVEYIFNAYVNEKKTLQRICYDLNNLKQTDKRFENVMKLKGKAINSEKWKYQTWNVSTVRRILNCSWYALGYRIWQNEKIMLDDSLKFIDIDLYNMANELLKINQHGRTAKKNIYFLNDLLFCSDGEKMRIKQTGNGHIYTCNLNIIHNYDKNIKCNVGKGIEVEKLQKVVWNFIKNKLPEFKIELDEKTSTTRIVNEKIEHNNQLIESIKNTTIENLNKTRKRTLNTFSKFGGDEKDFELSINDIDNEIKQQNQIISELKTDIKMLNISVQNLDIASEIESNIKIIESDKSLMATYLNKLIKKITLCGGLKGQQINIFDIEWNDNVNNNVNTFLFYHSKTIIKPNYYYISSEAININPTVKANIKISWNTENKTFEIYDSEINETIELTVNQMIANLEKIDYFFNDDSEYDSTMNFLIHFVNYDFYDKDNNLIPKKDLLMYDVDLLKRKFNFNNNAGIQKLQIVTPFV